MRHFLYKSAAALILCSALSVVGSGCSSKEKAAQTTVEEELPMVEIQPVSQQEVPQITTYTATIEAFKTNNIATSTPNRIKSILVDVGSKVHAGQRVATLDNVNIDQIKINLDNTEREYNRARQLLEIGGGTAQSVDQLKAQLDAQKRQYTNMVENTILTSPISGVVTARNYDPGDMTGSLPILVIEQVSPVKVILNVSETDFTRIHLNMPVEIRLDVYGDELFQGHVSLIHPSINPQTRTFTVEVTIPNRDQKILPGMFARVTVNYGTKLNVVVPDRAVVKQSGSGNKYVYVYNPADQTVSYNKVEIGQRVGNSYEILSGVPDNAQVVISGQTRLANGVKVQLAGKTSTTPIATADSATTR